jgi:hypothetical protein
VYGNCLIVQKTERERERREREKRCDDRRDGESHTGEMKGDKNKKWKAERKKLVKSGDVKDVIFLDRLNLRVRYSMLVRRRDAGTRYVTRMCMKKTWIIISTALIT